jgi:hypothetical protein
MKVWNSNSRQGSGVSNDLERKQCIWPRCSQTAEKSRPCGRRVLEDLLLDRGKMWI